MVTLATTDTSTAGSTAITENRLTICTCSRAAARPRRRACTSCQTSRMMMPTSSRMVAALISRKETTTPRVGSIGVSPVSTTKVRHADSSAKPTANGASSLRSSRLRGSTKDGSNDGTEVSALVIPAMDCVMAGRPSDGGLMHSYHNVAELGLIRGTFSGFGWPVAAHATFQSRLKTEPYQLPVRYT